MKNVTVLLQPFQIYRSSASWFVRYCGQWPSLLWTSAIRPCSGPVRLPRKNREIRRCVRCVCATCGKGGLSTSNQLVGYYYSAPPLDVAYCLACPDWHCVLRQPAASQVYLLQFTQARQTTLTLLDQGACNGHRL